jgi:hypothetical protein
VSRKPKYPSSYQKFNDNKDVYTWLDEELLGLSQKNISKYENAWNKETKNVY